MRTLLGSEETLGPDEAASDLPDARPGPSRIGRFVVLRRLGMGSMGVVYAAYDEQLDRKVAVKRLQPQLKEGQRQRLEREANRKSFGRGPSVTAFSPLAPRR